MRKNLTLVSIPASDVLSSDFVALVNAATAACSQYRNKSTLQAAPDDQEEAEDDDGLVLSI